MGRGFISGGPGTLVQYIIKRRYIHPDKKLKVLSVWKCTKIKNLLIMMISHGSLKHEMKLIRPENIALYFIFTLVVVLLKSSLHQKQYM